MVGGTLLWGYSGKWINRKQHTASPWELECWPEYGSILAPADETGTRQAYGSAFRLFLSLFISIVWLIFLQLSSVLMDFVCMRLLSHGFFTVLLNAFLWVVLQPLCHFSLSCLSLWFGDTSKGKAWLKSSSPYKIEHIRSALLVFSSRVKLRSLVQLIRGEYKTQAPMPWSTAVTHDHFARSGTAPSTSWAAYSLQKWTVLSERPTAVFNHYFCGVSPSLGCW